MAEWSGFTDEDLLKVKRQSSKQVNADSRQKSKQSRDGEVQQRPIMSGRGRPRPNAPHGKKGARVQFSDPVETTQPVSAAALLSQPPVGSVPKTKGAPAEASSNKPDGSEKEVTVKDELKQPVPAPEQTAPVKEMTELTEDDGVHREMSDFDKFQKQQKVMEEQNKMKKKLLASAIQERKKKAKAEASRLVRIQHELDKLDHMLNADVSIIRDRIEEASRDFLEAQKRFQHAEKEYVEAKIDLHHKQEEKENLTEHLCTVIHQNELRKGKKLIELMEKLDMEASAEEMALDMNIPSAILLESVKLPKSPTSPDTDKTLPGQHPPLGEAEEKIPENTSKLKQSDNKSSESDQNCDTNNDNATINDQKLNTPASGEPSQSSNDNSKQLDENKNVEQPKDETGPLLNGGVDNVEAIGRIKENAQEKTDGPVKEDIAS